MKKAENTCQDCGTPLVGRSDKRFCDDSCRSNYHNNVNRSSRNLVRNINYKLGKNRRVLEMLNPNGKSRVSKRELLKNGFDFDCITSIYKTKAGKVYYFVYDQGYLALENDEYALVVKQEYVK